MNDSPIFKTGAARFLFKAGYSVWHPLPQPPPGQPLCSITAANKGAKEVHMIGSGIMVAPGVVLTAWHVVEEFKKQVLEGSVRLLASIYQPDGSIQTWNVDSLTRIDSSDICILTVALMSKLPEDRVIRLATISTRIPQPDDKILFFGIRGHNGNPEGAMTFEGALINLKFEINTQFCYGKVDHVILDNDYRFKGPVIDVNVPSLQGMSGGPAYNSEGKLIGILSFGIDDHDPLKSNSYISLLTDAALQKSFFRGWPAEWHGSPLSIRDRTTLFCGYDPYES